MSARREQEARCQLSQKTVPGVCLSQRCDGKQPICGQCGRAARAEDCEYTTGQEQSKVQILEGYISRLDLGWFSPRKSSAGMCMCSNEISHSSVASSLKE
jgi:hypothetical protein